MIIGDDNVDDDDNHADNNNKVDKLNFINTVFKLPEQFIDVSLISRDPIDALACGPVQLDVMQAFLNKQRNHVLF